MDENGLTAGVPDVEMMDISQLGDELELIKLPQDEVLFRQGDEGRSLYILVSGQLEIQVAGPGDHSYTLSTLSPTAIVGEISLLLEAPRTATAIARTDVTLWELPAENFRRGFSEGVPWARELLLVISRLLAKRLAATNRELVQVLDEVAREQGNSADPHWEYLRSHLFRQWLI